MVWHDATLFNQMSQEVPCHIIAAGARTTDVQRLEWSTWLVGSSDGSSCNLHEVWLWYFQNHIRPSL